MNACNVMFVSPVAYFKGGAETCLRQFLLNPAIVPRLVVPEEGELSEFAVANGIPVDVVDFGSVLKIRRPLRLASLMAAIKDAIRVGARLKKLAVQHKIDCIHSNGLKTHGMLAIAPSLSNVQVICHIHDIPYSWKESLFWRFLAARSSQLVLVSEHCWPGESLPDNVRVIPNAVAVNGDEPVARPFHAPLSIGYVGRILPYKGVDIAVKWLAAAARDGYQFQFSIRGDADADNKEYESSVRNLIQELGLEDRCTFEGRINDFSQLYSGLDLVLMPSVKAEPFGLVALECFDQGVVCMAYPSGALPSIIDDGVTGYLCRDENEFLSALTDVCDTPDQFTNVRQSAYRVLQEKYAVGVLYERLNALYGEMSVASREVYGKFRWNASEN